MTAVTYAGPHDAVYLPDGTRVERGETVDVPDDIAGTAPDGNDLGSGLLAQVASWHAPGGEPRLDTDDPGADATIDDLLAYVDGDPAKAAAVRSREEDQSNPRKTLIAQLDEITTG